MNPYTTVAQKAAFRVSRTINQIFDRVDKLSPEQRADPVIFNEFYKQIEGEMVKEIQAAYPEHSIETKHLGFIGQPNNSHCWYISGLSGKENFIAHNDHVASSLAYVVDDKIMSAVVYNPLRDHTYMASRNEGAVFDEKRIRLGKHSGKLDDALFFTQLGRSAKESDFASFVRLTKEALAVRISGDVALDICAVAEGAASGFWLRDFHECDVKAAMLIALESGALVTDFVGRDDYYKKGELAIAHAKILKPFLQTLNIM